MNHFRIVTAYFPEGRETAGKIDRIFADKPELRTAILLSTIVTCLDRLLASRGVRRDALVKASERQSQWND
jgi:hypothetical protein